jgi:hypothetical protein
LLGNLGGLKVHIKFFVGMMYNNCATPIEGWHNLGPSWFVQAIIKGSAI